MDNSILISHDSFYSPPAYSSRNMLYNTTFTFKFLFWYFLLKSHQEYTIFFHSVRTIMSCVTNFLLKRGWGVKACSIFAENFIHQYSLTFCLTLCFFVYCQIFSRDSFRDINIIDIFIPSSRDTLFMKRQPTLKGKWW